MDPVTLGTVVLAIISGVAGEAGSRLWDGLKALIRRPVQSPVETGDPAEALPSGMAEFEALEHGPVDERRIMALSQALLSRAYADQSFQQSLENWWAEASQIRADQSSVTNTISGGTQQGPVLQGRDFGNISFGTSEVAKPLPGSRSEDS